MEDVEQAQDNKKIKESIGQNKMEKTNKQKLKNPNNLSLHNSLDTAIE